ncbi:MAG TPA: DUF5317 family protein, partial [Dehalococcoidia bacterium]
MTLSRSTRLAAATSLASAMMLLQFAVIRWSPAELPVRIVLPATVALVPAALWPLRHRIGVWIMFVGLAANLAPIVANGGLMPIEYQTVVNAVGVDRAGFYEPGAWIKGSKDVLVAPGDGQLTALGDGIIVRIGPARGFAASPGDLVIFAGFLVLVVESSVAW